MILRSLMLVLLWMPVAGLAQDEDPDLTAWLANGDRAFQEEDYASAVEVYRKVIQADPHNVRALHQLARLYATASDPEFFDGKRAVELALLARDDSPTDPAIIDTLAMGYFAQNKIDRAVAECLVCIQLNPYEMHYYRQLRKYGRTWLARLELNDPGRDLPEKHQAAYYLGKAQFHLGEYEEAQKSLEQAFSAEGADGSTGLLLAKVLSARGEPERAVEIIHSLGEAVKSDAPLLAELGRAHCSVGDLEEGVAALEGAYGIEPDLAGLHRDLGSCYLKLRKHVKAIIVLKEGLDQLDREQLFSEREEAEMLYLLGKALSGAGEQKDGLRYLFEAVSLAPDLPGGERDLAAVYIQQFGSSKGFRSYLAGLRHSDVPFFTEESREAGLDHTGTPAFGDFDGDGDPDLLLSGIRLFSNDGRGAFRDVTEEMGLTSIEGQGGIFGDYDNDGDLDIYILAGTAGMREKLLRNEGRKGFVDVSEQAGNPSDLMPTQGAAFADFNSDGYLDLYLANGAGPDSPEATAYRDSLILNRGDDTFFDVTRASGLGDLPVRCATSVIVGDTDNDGDLDILITHAGLEPNSLLVNDGNMHFDDRAAELGAAGHDVEGRFGDSRGADLGDIDGDGDLDIFLANRADPSQVRFADRSQLLVNSGRPLYRFRDLRAASRVRYAPHHNQSVFGDFNNDRNLDLFVTAEGSGGISRLYLGHGNGKFTDVTWVAGVLVDRPRGCAVADIDLDGDLDLFVGGANRPFLFINQGNDNHWVAFRLERPSVNGGGIGARLTLDHGTGSQIREIQGGRGLACQDGLMVQFGLGDYHEKVSVSVQWPDGKSSFFTGLRTDQIHTLKDKK